MVGTLIARDRSTPFAGCTMPASDVTTCDPLTQRASCCHGDDAQRSELSAIVDQSSLAPDNFTTLPHFSVSSTMSLPKSLGEPVSAMPPRSASRAFIFESATPASISLLSLSMISTGVFLGAPTPNQPLAS